MTRGSLLWKCILYQSNPTQHKHQAALCMHWPTFAGWDCVLACHHLVCIAELECVGRAFAVYTVHCFTNLQQEHSVHSHYPLGLKYSMLTLHLCVLIYKTQHVFKNDAAQYNSKPISEWRPINDLKAFDTLLQSSFLYSQSSEQVAMVSSCATL